MFTVGFIPTRSRAPAFFRRRMSTALRSSTLVRPSKHGSEVAATNTAVHHIKVDADVDGIASVSCNFHCVFDHVLQASAAHVFESEDRQLPFLSEVPLLPSEVAVYANPDHILRGDGPGVQDATGGCAPPYVSPDRVPDPEIKAAGKLDVADASPRALADGVGVAKT